MSKLITVYIDGKPSYNLDVKENTTIEQLKKSIKDFDKYDSTFYSNKNSKVNVLNTDKYDKFSLSSIWPSMKNSKIELISLPDLNSLSSNQTKNKLTGDKNVDKIILMNLSDKDLGNMCKVNNYTRSLCQDDNFWMNRTLNRFKEVVDPNVLKDIRQKEYKSWRDYYIYLVNFLEKMYDSESVEFIDPKYMDIYLKPFQYRPQGKPPFQEHNIAYFPKRKDLKDIFKVAEENSLNLGDILKKGDLETAEEMLHSKFINPNIFFDKDIGFYEPLNENVLKIIKFLLKDERIRPKLILSLRSNLGKYFDDIMNILFPYITKDDILDVINYTYEDYQDDDSTIILLNSALKKGATKKDIVNLLLKFYDNDEEAIFDSFSFLR